MQTGCAKLIQIRLRHRRPDRWNPQQTSAQAEPQSRSKKPPEVSPDKQTEDHLCVMPDFGGRATDEGSNYLRASAPDRRNGCGEDEASIIGQLALESFHELHFRASSACEYLSIFRWSFLKLEQNRDIVYNTHKRPESRRYSFTGGGCASSGVGRCRVIAESVYCKWFSSVARREWFAAKRNIRSRGHVLVPNR